MAVAAAAGDDEVVVELPLVVDRGTDAAEVVMAAGEPTGGERRPKSGRKMFSMEKRRLSLGAGEGGVVAREEFVSLPAGLGGVPSSVSGAIFRFSSSKVRSNMHRINDVFDWKTFSSLRGKVEATRGDGLLERKRSWRSWTVKTTVDMRVFAASRCPFSFYTS